MEEKIIIEGEFIKKNKMVSICSVLAIISMIISIYINGGLEDYTEYLIFPDAAEGIAVFFWLAVVFGVAAIYFWIELSYCEMVVTDKRVYGRIAFGKSIDLPYDKISSVGTCFPDGVFIATSSGLIKFKMLTNQKELYQSISDLLKQRQKTSNSVNVKKEQNSVEELKEFKELLDNGIITQEEFDAKKKKLLDL